MELTIQIEKSVPAAAEITLGPPAPTSVVKDGDMVTQITQQIIHGNYTNVMNTGENASIRVNLVKGDRDATINALVEAGFPAVDAAEFSEILASEKPESDNEPFGKKAKIWITSQIGKAFDGTWKIGVAVATKVLTEAAKRYYGLG